MYVCVCVRVWDIIKIEMNLMHIDRKQERKLKGELILKYDQMRKKWIRKYCLEIRDWLSALVFSFLFFKEALSLRDYEVMHS